jgi:hypothetical protein
VRRNLDRRIKVGSDIFNLFVFYKNDDETSKNSFLMSNYNKDGSPEAAHFAWELL